MSKGKLLADETSWLDVRICIGDDISATILGKSVNRDFFTQAAIQDQECVLNLKLFCSFLIKKYVLKVINLHQILKIKHLFSKIHVML